MCWGSYESADARASSGLWHVMSLQHRLWVFNENLSKMHNDECETESMCLLAETQIITLAAEKL